MAFAGREPAAGRVNDEGPESERGVVETIPEQYFLNVASDEVEEEAAEAVASVSFGHWWVRPA